MKCEVEFTGFYQRLLRNGVPFTAKIYDGQGEIPPGFNAVLIALDAGERSLLQWENALARAHTAIQKGYLILWELELDLLEGSLEDEARFLTLQLNIRHFTESVWPSFFEHSLGIALFKGAISFNNKGPLLHFAKSLGALLPEETLCFLFMEVSSHDCIDYFYLVSQDFGHLVPILKGEWTERFPYAVPALSWGQSFSPLGFIAKHELIPLESKRLTSALCLPAQANRHHLAKAIASLGTDPFRVIPEEQLTHEWDGIDTLVTLREIQSEQFLRKVRGFVAAGGIVQFL